MRAVGIEHAVLTAWINDAKKDPIPEVRYAIPETE